MASNPEGLGNNEVYSQETAAEFFRGTVQRMLLDNRAYVSSGFLDAQRQVKVLRLIDAKPQGGTEIDYHCVYTLLDATTDITTHGILIANPWNRWSYKPPKESRHYFEGDESVIVREDRRRKQSPKFEFLNGHELDPEEIGDPEVAALFASFHEDIAKVWRSQPVGPLRIMFDQFAQRKK